MEIIKRRSQRRVGIDIHPLIDVVFLLLIFFMVTTTFSERPGMKLELPASETAEEQPMRELTVVLTYDQRVFFQGREIALENLSNLLEKALERSSEKMVIISADQRVEYGRVVAVMDIAKKSGATGLTIATRPANQR